MVLLGFRHGLRREEISLLRWDAIDWLNGQISIQRSRLWQRGTNGGGLEAIGEAIGDRVPGLQGLAFADFEIGHGTDGYGDRQTAGSVGVRDGDWEIEGLVLKAAAPIRTPTIPVMISFCMAKGDDSNWV
jgi:hypothetical protein